MDYKHLLCRTLQIFLVGSGIETPFGYRRIPDRTGKPIRDWYSSWVLNKVSANSIVSCETNPTWFPTGHMSEL